MKKKVPFPNCFLDALFILNYIQLLVEARILYENFNFLFKFLIFISFFMKNILLFYKCTNYLRLNEHNCCNLKDEHTIFKIQFLKRFNSIILIDPRRLTASFKLIVELTLRLPKRVKTSFANECS